MISRRTISRHAISGTATAWTVGTVLAAALLAPLAAQAQSDWPSKPVEIVVPFPPGGGYDTVARPLSEFFSRKFNQRFVVVNKPGAVGMIGAQHVVSAKPDGYTLLMNGSGPGLNNMLTYKNITYNPIRDLAPIIVISEFPMIIAASKDFPANNLKEFVDHAKANPGKVNYATSGLGAQGHLTAELFILKTGIKLNMVPFQGSGPASAAVVAGHVPVTFDSVSAYIPHIQAGTLKALAVTTGQRAVNLPNVPTIREAGFPEAEAGGWYGLSGPAAMPADIVSKLNAATQEWMNSEEGTKILNAAALNKRGGSPTDMAKFLDEEFKKWDAAVKAANIVVQ